MHEGDLAMTGRRPGRLGRLFARGAALLAALLLLGLAGCSQKSKSITYPPAPDQTGRPWIFDVWGTDANDVFMVGTPGILLHWHNGAWELRDLGTREALTGVWGTGPADVYAVGHKGLVFHYDGSTWTKMAVPTSENLYDVGRGPGDAIYVCGGRGTVLKLAGGAWVDTPDSAFLYNPAGTATVDTLVRSRNTIRSLTCVNSYAISGSDGVVLMSDVSPNRWRLGPIGVKTWLNAGWSSTNLVDNWLASDTGKLYRLQSNLGLLSWLEVSSPSTIAVEAMWGAPDALNYYFVDRDGKIILRTATGAVRQTVYSGRLWLSGIWGSAANDIYAVGYDATVLHWDGTSWTTLTVPLPATKALDHAVETDKFGRPLS